MSNQPIQVFVMDDHAMIRKGMKALLNECEDICVVGDADNGLHAIEQVERLKPDVVLINMKKTFLDGLEIINRILSIQPDQRVIVLSSKLLDDSVFQPVKAGSGLGFLYIDTQSEDLIQTIRNSS